LRPEFVLGLDRSHQDLVNDGWGADRLGEDVLTTNVIGFNVQVYDPRVSFFCTTPKANPTDTPTPAGWMDGGNSLVVGPDDPAYRQVLDAARDAIESDAATPIDADINRSLGGYVDLMYPVLAGGPLRGWQARQVDRRGADDTNTFGGATGNSLLITPFSGVALTSNDSRTAYQTSLYRSGKLVTTGTTINLLQPTFDTYTLAYETDAIQQGRTSGNYGTRWGTPTPVAGIISGGTTITTARDIGADGIDNDNQFGVDDRNERETLPPFVNAPESIRISVRVENPSVRLIRQASVVHRDERN
ncbi:MAG: hypothetical protein AAGA03_12370, partial [Planctomycetota bacterium]